MSVEIKKTYDIITAINDTVTDTWNAIKALQI